MGLGAAYLLIYLMVYVLPLVGSVLLIWFLTAVVLRRVPGRFWISLVGVAVLSSIPWAFDRMALRQELAAYAPDTIFPNSLTLEPGTLWHIEEGNHAGVTCSWQCPFEDLAFVTGVGEEGVSYALQLDNMGTPVSTHNLWDGLYETPRRADGSFPYDYAYIGMSQYLDFDARNGDLYYKPHWPQSAKGVQMLVRVPPDGQLDFATAEVLYRRYNVQRDMALPFLWGIASATVQVPSTATIFDDFARIVGQ